MMPVPLQAGFLPAGRVDEAMPWPVVFQRRPDQQHQHQHQLQHQHQHQHQHQQHQQHQHQHHGQPGQYRDAVSSGTDETAGKGVACSSIRQPGSLAGLLHLDFWSLAADEQPLSWQAQMDLLDPHERARLSSLRRPQDGQRYLAAHAGMRLRLARWLDAAPAALHIGRGEFGKPLLSDHPQLHFNLSHSDGHAMLALATVDIGVDIEPMISSIDLSDDFMQQILAPAEMLALAGMETRQQADSLTRHWVRKEAVMKASGLGFRLAPADVLVDCDSGQVKIGGGGRSRLQTSWNCHLVAAPAGHAAAIAMPDVGSRGE